MSDTRPPSATLPPGMTEAEFAALPEAQRQTWTLWQADVRWLMDQPAFRRVAMRFFDGKEFCDMAGETFSTDPLLMARRTGTVAAGRLLQIQLQHISPRRYRQMLNEESNARVEPGTEASNG